MLYFYSLLCGVLFGLGLAISQMVNPAKVLNFLDIAGQWDPSLGIVFAGALLVAIPGYQWILRRRHKPVAAGEFDLPTSKSITLSLVGGSAIFGVGWGLAGICPGPGITALPTLFPTVILWVVMLFAGAACYRFLAAR